MSRNRLMSIYVGLCMVMLWGGIWRLLIRDQKVQGEHTSLSPSQILSLVNLERTKLGKTPLHPNEQLNAAALAKAQDMFDRKYFDHTDSEGNGSWDLIIQAGYQYQTAGENLARNFTSSQDVVEAWMRSPSHRENMLSDQYQDIGIAVMEEKDQVYIVKLMATPLTSQSTAPQNGQNFYFSKPLSAFEWRILSNPNVAKGLASFTIALTITAGLTKIYALYHHQKKPALKHWIRL